MSYKELQFKITGVAPLILHNGQTADPLNQHSKSIAEITGKRKKTDADHREVARREWFAGLYLYNGEPCIPFQILEATLIEGAKKHKRGPAAKAGLIVELHAPLEYDGPRKPDELWEDERFRLRVSAKIGTSRVMRTRPMFPQWSAMLAIQYLPDLLNPAEVLNFLVTAGVQIGLGDWRPRFGRFNVADSGFTYQRPAAERTASQGAYASLPALRG